MTADPGRVDRWLFLTTGEDPSGLLRALGTLVLCHGSVEGWFWVLELERAPAAVVVFALLHTLLFAIGFAPGMRRPALAMAAGVLLVQVVWTFPYVANHTFLRLLVLGLLAFPRVRSEDEQRLVQAALGWIAVIVLFYTGFQKLLYATYFRAEYLGYMVGLTDRFAAAFEYLVPAGEWERLRAIGEPVPGAGPYRVDAPLFVALSNLVYLVEMGLAAGLLWRRTRALSVAGTLTLIVLIEVGAREVFFGLMFCSLILLLEPRGLLRRLVPVILALYVLVLAAGLFGWPGLLT